MMPKICFVELNDERIQEAISKIEHVEVVIADDLKKGFDKLQQNEVDGLIAGAVYTTKEIIKESINKIGSKNNFASSYFLMKKNTSEFLFADCGFNINPNAEQLATIALQTAESALKLNMKPKVALISYSTKGSAQGESVEKINKAIKIIKKKNPEIIVDGELQLDAAINKEVAKKKCPDSPLKGEANVLIFPDLNSGNIGYKLLKELGGFTSIGPILQGFNKEIHDLSRACSVNEIIESANLMKKKLE